MSARSFLDTNILIQADDKEAPAKQRRALDLVAAHRRAGAFRCRHAKLHVEASVARLWSAKLAGCSVLLAEDFQEAREVDGLGIVNPFR